MPSIFEKIRGSTNLQYEAKNIRDYLDREEVMYERMYFSLNHVINSSFKFWKFKGNATSVKDYLTRLGINFERELTDDQCLMYFEFIFNFSIWIKNLLDLGIANQVFEEVDYYEAVKSFEPVADIVRSIVESFDYIFIKHSDGTYRLLKKDSDLESVISQVTDESVRIDLLAYLDRRNLNNLVEKKAIITRLYVYLEQSAIREKYQNGRLKLNNDSKEIDPYDNFFYICNNFKVRHGTDKGSKKQIVLSESETIELCDIAFYMFLQAHRIPIIDTYNKKIKALKEEHSK